MLNDEAHHIHDPRMAWFKSIEDIHNRLRQKERRWPAGGRDGHAEDTTMARSSCRPSPIIRWSRLSAERGEASGAAGRSQPGEVAGTPEREVHREIRRLS